MLNSLKQLQEDPELLAKLLNQITKNQNNIVPNEVIERMFFTCFCFMLFLLVILFIINVLIYNKRFKSVQSKLPIVKIFTYSLNLALFFSGIIMLIYTFLVYDKYEDINFFSISSVISTTLITIGLSMSVYIEQTIENKLENEKNKVLLIEEIAKRIVEKLINNSDLSTIPDKISEKISNKIIPKIDPKSLKKEIAKKVADKLKGNF
jgi:magnesium-transporting ATPase (P-type)